MPEIRQITVDEFFAHRDANALLDEYAVESSIVGMPPPKPNADQYRVIEQAGALCVLAALERERMVGFIALLVALNPHYSAVIGVVESFFVAEGYRRTGAGLRLLYAAEDVARQRDAVGFLVSAPYGGKLAEVMNLLGAYRETNRVFFRGFA